MGENRHSISMCRDNTLDDPVLVEPLVAASTFAGAADVGVVVDDAAVGAYTVDIAMQRLPLHCVGLDEGLVDISSHQHHSEGHHQHLRQLEHSQAHLLEEVN